MSRLRFSVLSGFTVSEASSKSPLCIDPGAPLARLRKLLAEERSRIAYVCLGRKLVGVVDRRHALMVSSRKSTATVANVMEEPVIAFSPGDSLEEAVGSMIAADAWYAPVTSSGQLEGSLGLENVIGLILSRHPGLLKDVEARDAMTPDPLTASRDDPVSKIWRYMVEKKFAGLPVVDERHRLIGIITQHDLLSRGYTRIELESPSGPRKGPRVGDAMNPAPVHAYPWTSLLDVARIMLDHDIGRVPIVNSEKVLLGIVDREDVLKAVSSK